MDDRQRHGQPGDGEVLHRPSRLGAPQGVGRHLDIAHRVVFDPAGAMGITHGTIMAQSLRSRTLRTLWSSPLDSTRLARPRVVTTLSIRFGPLIEPQMPWAVSRACSSVSAA